MLRNHSLLFAIGVSLALMAANAAGTTLNLADQNSSVAITPSSSAGLTNWTVNGKNYATQQWFWYSVDGGAPASLDTLPMTAATTFSINGGTRGGYVTYSGSNGLTVELIYVLTGGSTATQSDLSESIRLMNTGSTAHTYHFYQYSDFNLSQGTSDTEQFTNANTVTQKDGSLIMQTVTTPQPSYYEGGNFSSPNTLAKLTGGAAVNLADTPAIGATFGPYATGLTWAYQWDAPVAANSSYIISDDQQISPVTTVPEPSTVALLFACGGTVLMTGVWRRRRIA